MTSSSAPNFAGPTLKGRLYDAWIATRFELPLIAGRIEYGILPDHPSHLGTFVYDVAGSEEELQAWAKRSLFIYELEDPSAFQETIEHRRVELTAKACPESHPTTMHVVLSMKPDSEGK